MPLGARHKKSTTKIFLKKIYIVCLHILREAAKKSSPLNGRAIKMGRGGGWGKGRATKEKRTFFGTFFSTVPKFQRPLSSRGEGVRP